MTTPTHSSNHSADKKALRQALRRARRALPPRRAQAAAKAVAERVCRHKAWQRAQHVAIYLSGDGELDTGPLIDAARRAGKTVYLPVIRPPRGRAGRRAAITQGSLVFRQHRQGAVLKRGVLWVLEPVRGVSPTRFLAKIDLMIMPLVGFDDSGYRLGMGGGFYDRTLAGRGRFRRPYRLGIAHACQRVAELPHDPWDQRLDTCVTDIATVCW